MVSDIQIGNLSPLRYPGSKKRLAPYLDAILKYNNLQPDVLIEPFVGGGSVALYFLQNNIVEKVIIADNDKLIYSFWYVLFSKPNYLINFIKRVKIDLDNFYAYKQVAKHDEDYEVEKLAEACIFLNRTSFSGILTNSAGPIGGAEQKSKYDISCRFKKEKIIEKIKHISSFRKRVIILPYDWEKTIKYVERWATKRKRLNRLFFYFDPPFYKQAELLYRKYFSKEKHKKLCEYILSLKQNWVLSYDNVPEIKKMYSKNGNITMHVEMPYSVHSHSQRLVKELVISPLFLPPN
jgi:DNA adenine methylase